MSVWFVIPSKRPPDELSICLNAWREMGYRIAIAREPGDALPADCTVDNTLLIPVAGYLGWARSTNLLVNRVMAQYADAQWFVAGGDDYFPDPAKSADAIAGECEERFLCSPFHDATFGVMQPTGDRWEERNGIARIDGIAGSPWMGREFCRRMYNGTGPMFNGYYHNFADEELQVLCQTLDVFWQRRDLCQMHRHWARKRGDWADAPAWAYAINDPHRSDWDYSKRLFNERKRYGFPGHEPIAR